MLKKVRLDKYDLNVAKEIHSWDRYPAKMSAKLARHIIRRVSSEGDTILDTFSGCGTVQVECCRLGRHSKGVDINPVAALLASAKANRYDTYIIKEMARQIEGKARALRAQLALEPTWIDYWFSRATLEKLMSLSRVIDVFEFSSMKYRAVLKAALAVAVRKCSRADPRSPKPFISRTARESRVSKHFDAFFFFREVVEGFCLASDLMWADVESAGRSLSRLGDSRMLCKLFKKPVDAVVTSPPYLTAQDYWRSSKLEHAIVYPNDQDAVHVGPSIIGSGRGKQNSVDWHAVEWMPKGLLELRERNSHASLVVLNYMSDMNLVLSGIRKMLKPGGFCCMVVGDCQISGIKLPISEWCIEWAEGQGLHLWRHEVDAIRNRRVPPKRQGHTSVIANEHILYFK